MPGTLSTADGSPLQLPLRHRKTASRTSSLAGSPAARMPLVGTVASPDAPLLLPSAAAQRFTSQSNLTSDSSAGTFTGTHEGSAVFAASDATLGLGSRGASFRASVVTFAAAPGAAGLLADCGSPASGPGSRSLSLKKGAVGGGGMLLRPPSFASPALDFDESPLVSNLDVAAASAQTKPPTTSDSSPAAPPLLMHCLTSTAAPGQLTGDDDGSEATMTDTAATPLASTLGPNDPALAAVLDEPTFLGRGAFGTVYRVALACAPGGAAARKVLPITAGPGDTAGTDAALRTELRVAKRLHACANPRLLRIFATNVGATEATIDMELLDAGSLARFAPLSSEGKVAAMAQQLLLGLQALHAEVGVLHRDIKLQNILASRDGRVKLVDFGCAALGPDPAAADAGSAPAAAALSATDQQGTIAQMAPERLRGEAHGPASDVWSLGVALAELATGAHPFLPRDEAGAAASTERFWALAAVLKHTGTAAECEAATEAAVAAALAPCGAELRAFLGAMLRAPAASRATVAELLEHPFVTSIGFVETNCQNDS